MITSKKTTTMYKPIDGEKIPDWTVSYFRQRNKNRVHSLILSELKKAGVSQAELARRLGKKPDVICRWIGAAGNWTLDTVSDLLFAINGNEVDYSTCDPFHKIIRNYKGPEWVAQMFPVGNSIVTNKSVANAITIHPIS